MAVFCHVYYLRFGEYMRTFIALSFLTIWSLISLAEELPISSVASSVEAVSTPQISGESSPLAAQSEVTPTVQSAAIATPIIQVVVQPPSAPAATTSVAAGSLGIIFSVLCIPALVFLLIKASRTAKASIPNSVEARTIKLISGFSVFSARLVLTFLAFILILAPEQGFDNFGRIALNLFLLYLYERLMQFTSDKECGVVYDPNLKVVQIPTLEPWEWSYLRPFKSARVTISVRDIRQISRWLETSSKVIDGKVSTSHKHKLNIITPNKHYSVNCSDDARMDAVEHLFHDAMHAS